MNRGKDLLELINDLLNLSRSMGEKGIALDIEEFDVVAMLQDRMEGIGTIAKKNRNVIEFQPAEGGVGCMTADKGKVWRILMNLLSNACKFTRNGTVTLTVEPRVRRQPAPDHLPSPGHGGRHLAGGPEVPLPAVRPDQ